MSPLRRLSGNALNTPPMQHTTRPNMSLTPFHPPFLRHIRMVSTQRSVFQVHQPSSPFRSLTLTETGTFRILMPAFTRNRATTRISTSVWVISAIVATFFSPTLTPNPTSFFSYNPHHYHHHHSYRYNISKCIINIFFYFSYLSL